MGILKQALKVLLFENEWKPIQGRVLLIGRSTVAVKYSTIERLMSLFGLMPPPRRKGLKETRHASSDFDVDDRDLFLALSDKIEEIDVLDISPYEGANVVADLNFPIPTQLQGRYDFIYDSSVVDNLFNPAEALSNFARMLKPHGRLVGVNVSSFYPGAMVSCHPEWFHGFFAVNGFADAKVYLSAQHQEGSSRFDFTTYLYRYKPTFTPQSNYNHFESVIGSNAVFHSIVIAELGSKKLDEIKFPVNLQYIESSSIDNWANECFSEPNRPWIISSDRRLFDSPRVSPSRASSALRTLPHRTDHYVSIGDGF